MSWGSLASTRRRFLLSGMAVGATATSAPALLTGCTPAPQQAPAPSAPDWAALARDLKGRLLRKDDPDYRRFAQPYNLAYDTPDRMPQGIALCAGPADVSTSIKWAQANGIALRGRSGGHSYGGFSTTPDFMIDVSAMNSVGWHPATKRVTAASGARNGDLYKVLRAENRMMTHGRCPTVGVAGFLLGGGIGFNMRLLGVASDDLAATEIVTADGAIHRLPEMSRDDLFWACRGGGGGNFGLNTSFTLNTNPAGGVTVFIVNWQGTRAHAAYSNGEAYQNFIDPSLTDWQQAYYATNLGRLRDVKGKVDRGEVFKFPQSIPPAP